MFLKGDTISIRALEPSDANLLYAWENELSLWPVSFTQIPFSKFILEEFVSSAPNDIYTNKQLRLMITSLSDNRTIGIIDLFDFDPQHLRCGLGIYIHSDFRKLGHAAECVELIKKYCFSILFLKQIYVHVNETNKASLALFTKSHFEKSGVKKAWNKTGVNSYEDVWFLQCINTGD
jgi:diamine N-acetyltransferase